MSVSDETQVTRLFASTPAASDTHRLKIETGHPLIEAFVINGALDLVAQGQDTFVKELPEGTYQIKFRSGNTVTEQWVNLTEDCEVYPETLPRPESSLPSEDIWTSQEREAAEQFIARHQLAVIIRDPEHEITPSDQVSIRSLAGEIFVQTRSDRPGQPGWEALTDAPIVGLGGPAEPGPYLLRITTPEIGTYETVIWVSPNHKTRVYLTRKFASAWKKRRRTPHLGSATIHIVADDHVDLESQRRFELTEIILAALREERSLQLTDETIMQALEGKTQNAMLGLLAAHMLHVRIKNSNIPSQLGDQNDEMNQLRHTLIAAINNLDRLMPGCPDVGSLGLAYGIMLQGINYSIPPMLGQSWVIIASANEGRLVPSGSYAARIAPAITAERPWLIWRTNQLIPARVENSEGSTIENLQQLQERIKISGLSMPNALTQMLATIPLSQYQSVQEIAQVMGVPTCSIETSIAHMQENQVKSEITSGRQQLPPLTE